MQRFMRRAVLVAVVGAVAVALTPGVSAAESAPTTATIGLNCKGIVTYPVGSMFYLQGSLVGTATPDGRTVDVLSQNGDLSWSPAAQATTDARGTFRVGLSPRVPTVYSAVLRDWPSVASLSVTVKPRANVSPPVVPKRLKRNRTWWYGASFKTLGVASTFEYRLTLQRLEHGTWVTRVLIPHHRCASAIAMPDPTKVYSMTDVIGAQLKLSRRGAWRVRATVPAVGVQAAGSSAWKAFTVY